MTKKAINRAIRHLGIEIQKGYGYAYFTRLEENGKLGEQVGEMVCVCYLKHLPLERWVGEAEMAIADSQK
jgi:hypothetical protein